MEPRQHPVWLRTILNLCGPLGLGVTLLGWVRPLFGVIAIVVGFAYTAWETWPYLGKWLGQRTGLEKALMAIILVGVIAIGTSRRIKDAYVDSTKQTPASNATPPASNETPEVYPLEPRTSSDNTKSPTYKISRSDRDVLITMLSSSTGQIDICSDMLAGDEVQEYADEWYDVFKRTEWVMTTPGPGRAIMGDGTIKGAVLKVGGWPKGSNPFDADARTKELGIALQYMKIHPIVAVSDPTGEKGKYTLYLGK